MNRQHTFILRFLLLGSFLWSASLTRADGAGNQPPVVSAGLDQTITLPAAAQLNGIATDDGQIQPLVTTWSLLDGPGAFTFGDASQLNTTVSFSQAGSFTLQLSAFDGQFTVTSSVNITVNPALPNPLLILGSGKTLPGTDIELPIDLQLQPGSPNIIGTQLDLVLPPGISFVSARPGVTIVNTNKFLFANATPTGATIFVASFDASPMNGGTFGYVTLHVDPAAALGLTPIPLTNVTSVDALGGVVATDHVDGSVRVMDPSNQSPMANAGTYQPLQLPNNTLTLNGTASDDGKPSNTLITFWLQLSGPGAVNISDPFSLTSMVTFPVEGTYVLRLFADDTELQGISDVTIVVNPNTPGNLPPVVSAGLDQTTTLPTGVLLHGTASDDGQTQPLVTTWAQLNGPGFITFGNANALDTTALFFLPGSYGIQLSAFDGQLVTLSSLTVTVNGGAGSMDPMFITGAFHTLPGNDVEIAVSLQPGSVAITGTQIDVLPPNGLTFVSARLDPAILNKTLTTTPISGGNTLKITAQDATPLPGRAFLYFTLHADPAIPQGAYNIALANVLSTEAAGKPVTTDPGVPVVIIDPPAITPAQLSMSSPSGSPGSDVVVSFTFTPSPDAAAASLQFGLTLPPNLTYVSSALGPAAAGMTLLDDPSQSLVILYDPNVIARLMQGDVVDVTLHIAPGAPSGSQNIGFRFSSLNDPLSVNIPLTTPPGSVTVNSLNQPPDISAGLDQTITLPAGAQMVAAATDDGLDQPLTFTWTKLNGPGTVAFSPNIHVLNPSVTFSQAGSYGIQLAAFDGQFTTVSSMTVTVLSGSPLAIQAVNALLNPISGIHTTLAAVVAGGLPPYTYQWSQPAGTSLDTSVANPTVTFSRAGTYGFSFTVHDSAGGSATQTLTGVVVNQTQTTVVVIPSALTLQIGQRYPFAAQAQDQFVNPMTVQPSFLWSVLEPQATIDAATGQFTASAAGTYTVQAAANGQTGAATVTVSAVSLPALPAPSLQLPSILTLTSHISIDYPTGYSIDHFEWLFVPVDNSGAPVLGSGAAVSAAQPAGSVSWSSASPDTDLSLQPLKTGLYQVSLTAVDTAQNRATSAIVTVSVVSANLSGIQVYPNPWRKDRHDSHPVTFNQLGANVDVKIFSVSGRLVRNLGRVNGSVTWDLKNDSGDSVASGLYIYLLTDSQGGKARGKLAVIR